MIQHINQQKIKTQTYTRITHLNISDGKYSHCQKSSDHCVDCLFVLFFFIEIYIQKKGGDFDGDSNNGDDDGSGDYIWHTQFWRAAKLRISQNIHFVP